MALFRKGDSKKPLEGSERSVLFKKAYELGFEVGYRRHSELGWVSRSYSGLERLAREHGLEGMLDEHYSRGKGNGLHARKRDMQKGLCIEEKAAAHSRLSTGSLSSEKEEKTFNSGFRSSSQNVFCHIYAPIDKPKMTELPEMISLPQKVRVPGNIKGFRPLVPWK